jgi:rhodanese-related sulfurtransferase
MRSFYILLCASLIYLFACKNNPAGEQNGVVKTEQTAAPIDSSVVSVRSIDFYELTKAKPNMPIIDVRTPEEFKSGHLYRAINIPFTDPMYMNRIAAMSRTQEYAVYCAVGNISMELAENMKNLGFMRVYHMRGGLFTWGEAQQALQIN